MLDKLLICSHSAKLQLLCIDIIVYQGHIFLKSGNLDSFVGFQVLGCHPQQQILQHDAEHVPQSHLLVHSLCYLLVWHGHVLRGGGQHTLQQGSLPFFVVIDGGGHGQVCKAAEVCICAVQ